MPTKMIAETWKVNKKKRKDLNHGRLFARLSPDQRVVHLMECAPCLTSALDSVKRAKAYAKENGISA